MSKKKAIYLTRLEILNFKKIRALAIDGLKAGLTTITSGGKNRQGKTTTLDAIRTLFEGAGAVPPEPRRAGTPDDAESIVRGWFSNGFTITRKFTPKGSYLKATSPDGLDAKQTHLNSWQSGTGVDVLGFYALDEKEQLKLLMRLSSVPDLLEKIKEVDARKKALYEERTPHIALERQLSAVQKPEGEKPEPSDTAALMERLREVQAANRDRGDAFVVVSKREQDVSMIVHQINRYDNEIADLLRRVDKLKELRAEAEDLREKGHKEIEELRKAANDMPDLRAEAESIHEQLSQIDVVHRSLEPWNRWENAVAGLESAQAEKKRLTEALKECDQERLDLMASAALPIEGLSITAEGEIRLNDLPLSQASGRERVVLAAHVAAAANENLRIVMHDEGGDIDAEGLAELARFCEERDLQMFLCRLGLEGPGELEVIDGVGGDVDLLDEKDKVAAGLVEPAVAAEPEGQGGGLFG